MPMERRDFLTMSAAAVAAPLIPAGVTVAKTVVPAQTDILWAEAIARAKGKASVASIARDLRVSTPMAEAIQNQLIRKNIVRVGHADNVVALRPFENPLTRHAKGLEILSKENVQKVIEKVDDQMQESPQDESESEIAEVDRLDLIDQPSET